MDKIIALAIVLIHVLNVFNRLKTCFGFNADSFYHYFILAMKFLILVIHLNLNWGLQTFPIEPNNIRFFQSFFMIKLN